MKLLPTKSVCFAAAITIVTLVLPISVLAQQGPDSFIKRMDENGDGKISSSEYRGKRHPFGFFDSDGDGFATRSEIQNAMARPKGRSDRRKSHRKAKHLDGQISVRQISRDTRCAISRKKSCDINIAIQRGLIETGLRPIIPRGIKCQDIDEGWAIPLGSKRQHEKYHGGIDIPAPSGTPIIAVASGTVVAKFSGENTNRGIEIILRHSPGETGTPYWIYTQYAHLWDESPLEVGQQVRMGDVLGDTGNTGMETPGGFFDRRPAIHFAVWYSKSSEFAVGRKRLYPAAARWMDPNALYRKDQVFDSHTLRTLGENEKQVPIPTMPEGGTAVPAGTKLVWPYRC